MFSQPFTTAPRCCLRTPATSFIATIAALSAIWTNSETDDLTCPVCHSQLQTTHMIVTQVFTPQDARPLPEDDREQEITYATSAQFPVPVGATDLPDVNQIADRLSYVIAPNRKHGQQGPIPMTMPAGSLKKEVPLGSAKTTLGGVRLLCCRCNK
jgi:hypothetical protein